MTMAHILVPRQQWQWPHPKYGLGPRWKRSLYISCIASHKATYLFLNSCNWTDSMYFFSCLEFSRWFQVQRSIPFEVRWKLNNLSHRSAYRAFLMLYAMRVRLCRLRTFQLLSPVYQIPFRSRHAPVYQDSNRTRNKDLFFSVSLLNNRGKCELNRNRYIEKASKRFWETFR